MKNSFTVMMFFAVLGCLNSVVLAAELLGVKPVVSGNAVSIEILADIAMTYTFNKVPGQTQAIVDIAEVEEVIVVIVVAADALPIGLNAEHELIDLPVKADLAAADEAAIVVVVIVVGQEQQQWCRRHAREEDVIVEMVAHSEGAAGIHADIEASPSEDRNRRHVGRRGRPCRQIGSQRGSDHGRDSHGR